MGIRAGRRVRAVLRSTALRCTGLGRVGAGGRGDSLGPPTHHEDEGSQALSQRLSQQPVADVEHLPAAVHQLLLSTHVGQLAAGGQVAERGGRRGGGRGAVPGSAGWRPL